MHLAHWFNLLQPIVNGPGRKHPLILLDALWTEAAGIIYSSREHKPTLLTAHPVWLVFVVRLMAVIAPHQSLVTTMKAEVDVKLAVPPPPGERDGFAYDATTSIALRFIKRLTADLHALSSAHDLCGTT